MTLNLKLKNVRIQNLVARLHYISIGASDATSCDTDRAISAREVGEAQHEGGISDRIRQKMLAEFNKPFKKTAFYSGTSWSEARHPVPFVHPLGWAETFHHQLFDGIGAKRAQEAPAIDLVTSLRHALAHGAIAYLDADGRGIVGNTADRIAFISATNLDKKRRPKEYSVVTVREAEFSAFLRHWARWLLKVAADRGIALESRCRASVKRKGRPSVAQSVT
jgi:hypothetical protein